MDPGRHTAIAVLGDEACRRMKALLKARGEPYREDAMRARMRQIATDGLLRGMNEAGALLIPPDAQLPVLVEEYLYQIARVTSP